MQEINIVYAPGTGGNHVANIISMNNTYPIYIDRSVYDDVSTENVHQLTPTRTTEHFKIQLFHLGSFISKCRFTNVDPCAKNIVISLPKANLLSLDYQRLVCWAPEYLNQFFLYEHQEYYSYFSLTRLSKIKNWTVIQSSTLFNDDVTDLTQLLSNLLGLDIDLNLARTYHKKWLDKLKQYVDNHKHKLHQSDENIHFK
jgi:hypothetical protein